jgi:hypothetical protein
MSDTDERIDVRNPFTTLGNPRRSSTLALEAAAKLSAGTRAVLILGRNAKSAFYATLVLRLKLQPSWAVDTLATDGRELRYNPWFVIDVELDELVGVFAAPLAISSSSPVKTWRYRPCRHRSRRSSSPTTRRRSERSSRRPPGYEAFATRMLMQSGFKAVNVGGGYKTYTMFHPSS